MRRLWWLVGTTAAAVAAAAVGLPGQGPGDGPPQDGGPGDVIAAGVGLQPFDACDQLVDHLVADASVADPYTMGIPFGGFARDDVGGMMAAEDAAAPQAATPTDVDVSDTNVQVAGVDEPDLVETDGRRLYTAVDGRLHVVDVTTPTPALLADVPIRPDSPGGEAQLLLHGGRLLAITWGGGVMPLLDQGGDVRGPMPGSPVTQLTLFDVSTDQPTVVAEADIEGSLVAGRGVDGTVHLVLQHWPQPIAPEALQDVWSAPDATTAATRLHDALARTTATDWLPAMVQVDGQGIVTSAPAVDCATVYRTSEVTDTAMLEVLTFDLDGADLQPKGSAAVLTNATIVTATADELVVATPVWPDVVFQGPMPVEPGIAVEPDVAVEDAPAPPDAVATGTPATGTPATGASSSGSGVAVAPGEPVPDRPADEPVPVPAPVPPQEQRTTTRLHLFTLSPQGATYVASGEVDGQLLNQFSMSLDSGLLRVATTVGEAWTGNSESGVTILRRAADRLEVVGAIGGLGRGERIYAVRFLGPRAYVVTFRQTDPLYVLDLSDPTDPHQLGELALTGYSAYLHPLDGDRLLGVGQEATLEGRATGTKIALFDVSGNVPRLESQVVVPQSNSEAEYDHHAFLYHDGTLVVPFQRWFPEPTADAPQGFESGALVVRVGAGPLMLQGTVSNDAADPWQATIRRAVIVNGTLFTVSPNAVAGTALDTLAPTGTVTW